MKTIYEKIPHKAKLVNQIIFVSIGLFRILSGSTFAVSWNHVKEWYTEKRRKTTFKITNVGDVIFDIYVEYITLTKKKNETKRSYKLYIL